MDDAVFAPSLTQKASSHFFTQPHFAVDARQDRQLTYLDICRDHGHTEALRGLTLAVVGAGPAGLVFATAAANHGADVTVFEKAGDPRQDDPGYTDRSFNITLDNVGRQVLANPLAWHGGIWLQGRALHNFQGSEQTHYARYGHHSDAEYVSIPRPVLRQNMCSLAEMAGVKLRFRTPVTSLDMDAGSVQVKNTRHHADLVVASDGFHSLVNELCQPTDIHTWPEPRSYVTAMIAPKYNRGLSLRHIHLWHESSGAFTVGIPNADGSIDLLLASTFADVSEKAHPFETHAQARTRLRRDFPQLLADAPQLPEQLPSRRRGYFKYKSTTRYRFGKRGVVVGDAACAFPPWAGFGANQSMYAAASLAYFLAHSDSTEAALNNYAKQHERLGKALRNFAAEQGEFFSGAIAQNPSARSPDTALGPLIKEAKRQTNQ